MGFAPLDAKWEPRLGLGPELCYPDDPGPRG
jgi:hypothetical protein